MTLVDALEALEVITLVDALEALEVIHLVELLVALIHFGPCLGVYISALSWRTTFRPLAWRFAFGGLEHELVAWFDSWRLGRR